MHMYTLFYDIYRLLYQPTAASSHYLQQQQNYKNNNIIIKQQLDNDIIIQVDPPLKSIHTSQSYFGPSCTLERMSRGGIYLEALIERVCTGCGMS